MATRLIMEERDSNVHVALHRAGHIGPEPFGEDMPFQPVLEPQELENLRWYLEDYLSASYAVWEENGAQIRDDLP